jgi:thiamine-monophosphate kinase
MSEFDLIRRYFTRATPSAELGVGDDAALLRISTGMELAVSTDMLVSGTHFFADAEPYMLGHKTLAVNLSDMAAMGAQPRWATLAIALPEENEAWLEKFSAGFFALAQQYGVELIGGDTTRGPLNLCVTIMGEVPQGTALLRGGAQIGDEVWVSGTLGDAALALAHLQQRIVLNEAEFAACAPALHQPQPRVALGLALRGIANSAIDISDGLLADLGHILACSDVGAEIQFDSLPASAALRAYLQLPLGKQCVLSSGDDYELCFTAPAARNTDVSRIAARLDLPLTRIGEIVAGQGCIVHDAEGVPIDTGAGGYDHFQ